VLTYLLIDGENLDATLGSSILGRRPAPEERPRWDRVVAFARDLWGDEVRPLFFINASSGELPMPFLQALNAMGLRPVLLRGPANVKVVDEGIKRTLEALRDRPGGVVLGSHDGDFVDEVRLLLGDGRNVGLLGFRELFSATYVPLVDEGLSMLDLEYDAGAFNMRLPRMRVIDLADFDPNEFL
jgi:uncharacterized protein